MSRGWVLTFDGIDDYGEVFDHPSVDLGDLFEIEFELRPLAMTGNRTILSKGTGAYQLRQVATKLQLLKQGTGVIAETSPGALRQGAWHHVNVFKDGDSVGLLVDLEDVTVSLAPQTLVDNDASLFIGALDGTSEFFKGQLKDLRFWSNPRTDEQREKYRSRPLIPEMAGLMSWWPMYEGTGTKVTNVSA